MAHGMHMVSPQTGPEAEHNHFPTNLKGGWAPQDDLTERAGAVGEGRGRVNPWGVSLRHPHVTHNFGRAVALIIDTGHR